VASDRFLQLAQLQAKTLGMPDLSLIMIPHPLAGLEAGDAVKLGHDVAMRVLEMLDEPEHVAKS
jgi:hypothetical protein